MGTSHGRPGGIGGSAGENCPVDDCRSGRRPTISASTGLNIGDCSIGDLTGRISRSRLVSHPEIESHFRARPHFMLQAFFQALVITLREGFEAFLIVAISLAYLRKSGRSRLTPAVHWGIAVALGVSVLG